MWPSWSRTDHRRPARSAAAAAAAGRLCFRRGRARPAPCPAACRPDRSATRAAPPMGRPRFGSPPGNGGGPPTPPVRAGGCVRRPVRCAAAERQGQGIYFAPGEATRHPSRGLLKLLPLATVVYHPRLVLSTGFRVPVARARSERGAGDRAAGRSEKKGAAEDRPRQGWDSEEPPSGGQPELPTESCISCPGMQPIIAEILLRRGVGGSNRRCAQSDVPLGGWVWVRV